MTEQADLTWGPARWVAPAASCAAVAALVWILVDHAPEDQLVAGVLVVVAVLLAVTVVRMLIRLRATSDGIVVTGPLRSRPIPWARIDLIATPRRGRFGRSAASLEIDVRPGPAADDELLAFGVFDLGTDPAKVGRALIRLRREAGH
jgi:hypothetical protein